MANRIEFEVAVGANGFRRGIGELEQLAGVAGGRMSSAMAGGFMAHGGAGGGISGTIRESLVLLREAGRGNYTRMAGSATLLTQYLGGLNFLYRNSATNAIKAAVASEQLSEKLNLEALVARKAYEAEKATIDASNFATAAQIREVEALHLKALAAEEAAIAEGKNAEATALSARIAQASAVTTITPLGWIAAALLVVGTAAFFVVRHFLNLAKAQKEYADAVDATKKTFSDEMKAMDDAVKSDAELNRWLQKELSNRKDLLDVTRQRIEQLHRETEAQTELMRARGMSAVQIAAYQKSQLEQEEKILQAQKDKADQELITAKINLEAARSQRDQLAANGVNIGGQSYTQEGVGKARDQNAKVIDAIQDLMKDTKIATGWATTQIGSVATTAPTGLRPANSSDVMSIPGGTIPGIKENLNMSLDEAIKKQNELNDINTKVTKSFEDNADALEGFKGDVQAGAQNVRALGNDLQNVKSALGESDTKAKIAQLEDAKKGRREGDSLIKTGNFLGVNRNTIESLQAKQLTVLEQIEGHLRYISSHATGASGTGFSF